MEKPTTLLALVPTNKEAGRAIVLVSKRPFHLNKRSKGLKGMKGRGYCKRHNSKMRDPLTPEISVVQWKS